MRYVGIILLFFSLPLCAQEGEEVCNGVDDDGDEKIDEENAAGCETYYRDEDGDGWGAESEGADRCLCGPVNPFDAEQAGDTPHRATAVAPQRPRCARERRPPAPPRRRTYTMPPRPGEGTDRSAGAT